VTKAANCKGLLFHDLRRSAVKAMRHRGVTESAAMKITGHKTFAMLRRYHIVDEAELVDASAKLDAEQNSHNLAIC